MIRVIDLTVVRGPSRVVSELSVEIAPGRTFWVVGPNGAGKSSLLRVIVGMDPPRSGTVMRDGRLLYFRSEMALPPSVTVRAWDRLTHRLGRGGRAGHRTALWPDVGGARRVGRLSTGQRKRLLLDALLRQPGPLVLDEPFEHLSPGAKADLRKLLEERSRRQVVVVATNQHTARARRDGGLHLEAGKATDLTASVEPG